MYSRSFMYVKVQHPNMRLDISVPKSAPNHQTPKSESDQLTNYLGGSVAIKDLELEFSQSRNDHHSP